MQAAFLKTPSVVNVLMTGLMNAFKGNKTKATFASTDAGMLEVTIEAIESAVTVAEARKLEPTTAQRRMIVLCDLSVDLLIEADL